MSAPWREERGTREAAVLRVLRLIRLLETLKRPIGVDDVARQFRCCSRTVRRDVALIERLGARVAIERERYNDPPRLCGIVWEKDVIWRAA